MLNKSIKFLIQNKLIALISMGLIILGGLLYAPFDWESDLIPRDPISVDAIPDIGENQQIVYTEWPGASPEDIENQISYPLSAELLGIPGVKSIRSSSMVGKSFIYVIFEDSVDFYWSRSRILEKLNALSSSALPEGTKPNLGPDATGLGQIFWYTLEGRDQNDKTLQLWDLEELRTLQDEYIKYALSSVPGVAEVASVGGYVREYQIEVSPEKLRLYELNLADIAKSVKGSNQEIGAQTLEINQVEYLIRGLGYVKSIEDLEKTVVKSNGSQSVRLKDIAQVRMGPKERRGILDKSGSEVVGGVIVARFDANPMEVIKAVKQKIAQIEPGLPVKNINSDSKVQVKIIPFYDRTTLIKETINTLEEALNFEVLITVLVILFMVYNLRASLLISSMLPLAILGVFILMKFADIDANIVALSGIAIAIGTMVDMGIILSENILRHVQQRPDEDIDHVVYTASSEVSGAILTAVLTTIISFIPVFGLSGAEGKLFSPLAYTKTFALFGALVCSLFFIPPLATILFKNSLKPPLKSFKIIKNYGLLILLFGLGLLAVLKGLSGGLILIGFGLLEILRSRISSNRFKNLQIIYSISTVCIILAMYWQPLGPSFAFISNLGFVLLVSLGLLFGFRLFLRQYEQLLSWALENKFLFLILPAAIIFLGFWFFTQMKKEFMPALDEGAFLLMPTSMPHAGVEENKRVLQYLDASVNQIPEVKTVVGKAGRVESALDPAPLSMYENVILYKSEYIQDENGKVLQFKTDESNNFLLAKGGHVINPNHGEEYSENWNEIQADELIIDSSGKPYRNWRPEINTTDDIWKKILQASKLPGLTSAPKLQPIETRLIMLQTGMRAPMGIKIKGGDLKQLESFSQELEAVVKQVDGVKKEAVFADRLIGKPYLIIDIDREKLIRYGLGLSEVQDVIQIAVGGKILGQSVDGRSRIDLKLRYPKALRETPEDIGNIYVKSGSKQNIKLRDVADIRYERGPQMIKSEDGFIVSYLLFDKELDQAELELVDAVSKRIQMEIESGKLIVPAGLSFEFSGNYQNQIRAEKSLKLLIPLALIIIFMILYLQFKSISTSLMVFSGILVAFSGGFILLGLYAQDWFLNINFFGTDVRDVLNIKTINLSVAVWVGFIALFGIASDDGVLMATYLDQSFAMNQPKTKSEVRQAVIHAGLKRIRPCLMTSATTLLALVPVMMSSGRGSDLMIPMAIPSFGGMLFALITLFVVPVLYSLNQELKLKKYEI